MNTCLHRSAVPSAENRLLVDKPCGRHRGRPSKFAHPEKVGAGVLLSRMVALTALAALFLAGCGSLDPVVDTTRFYTLAPVAAGAGTVPAATDATPIGVRVTAQPDYLRRTVIAVRTSRNELRLVGDHRWAENLNEGIARVIAQDLQARLPRVFIVPVSSGGMTAGAATHIDITIVACEGSADGAILEAYWRMDTRSDDGASTAGHFREVSTGWDGADYGALAAQLSTPVDQLAAKIAAGVER